MSEVLRGENITLVSQGSYAVTSLNEPHQLGAYDLEDSLVVLVITDQRCALFNIDRLTHPKTLRTHILENFPGISPLTIKMPQPINLTLSSESYSREKSHLSEIQARLDINHKTINLVIEHLKRQREVETESFPLKNKPNTICIYHSTSGKITTGVPEHFGINNLQGKTLEEKITDPEYCHTSFTWGIRYLSGSRRPPMVNIRKLSGNLSSKHIQHMTKDSWQLGKLPLDEVYSANDREIEKRRYLFSIHRIAFTHAKIAVKKSKCRKILPYIEVDRAEQIITQAILNSEHAYRLLSLSDDEQKILSNKMEKLTLLLRKSVYHKTGLLHWCKARLTTDMESKHSNPRHRIDFNIFNSQSIHDLLDKSEAPSPLDSHLTTTSQ